MFYERARCITLILPIHLECTIFPFASQASLIFIVNVAAISSPFLDISLLLEKTSS